MIANALKRSSVTSTNAVLDAGLSGPSRLHDLCVSVESASPGEVKSGGAEGTIAAGFADTPFGSCLIAQNARGICHLSFTPSIGNPEGAEAIRID